jgi:glucose-6-phosphate 1-epimerase
MSSELAASYRRFEIPGVAEIVEGNGGLPKVLVTTPELSADMYLHGAQITSWKPSGAQDVLFVSSRSRWEPGHAIRGGVPICFPWFGAKSDDAGAPSHGFVRTKAWHLESISRDARAVTVSMYTESDESTRRWWPAEFHLECRATFGPQMTLQLVVSNTGSTLLRFEEALHAYFNVGDVRSVRLRGLNGIHYLDKTDSRRRKLQEGDVSIDSETDRVYLDSAGPVELEDPALRRLLRVTKESSRTTVVWNPWTEKARALPDLGDDEWMRMMCIESSNVGDSAVGLAPGERHIMTASVSLTPAVENSSRSR